MSRSKSPFHNLAGFSGRWTTGSLGREATRCTPLGIGPRWAEGLHALLVHIGLPVCVALAGFVDRFRLYAVAVPTSPARQQSHATRTATRPGPYVTLPRW